MTRDELAQLQKEQSVQASFSLTMSCRRRFLLAADLIELRSPAVQRLHAFGQSERVDLTPLLPAWRCICERYLSSRYDSQISLFEDHRTQLATTWEQFVYHKLFPTLIRDNELVRNILRALGGLPCQSREQAASFVHQYVLEMTLPDHAPLWMPEEEFDD
ncbi:MAG: hypothetical protein HZY76_04250 [Anaerolineae bacterium]|nr:MAG: hypothetical protein HZY76_04250 [Anaerolineae bacterium]